MLWQGAQGLVAPRSTLKHARLDAVCAEFAARGWPVRLRRSGGGVVPQGPGIVNLSIATAIAGAPGDLAERLYAQLCDLMARSLAAFGVDARPRAVEGAFCDGRFNLAIGGRKIAGAAQVWRRAGGAQAVLVHALLLVDVDLQRLTDVANSFEAALGSERRYRAGTMTTVANELVLAERAPPADLADRLTSRLADAFAAAAAG